MWPTGSHWPQVRSPDTLYLKGCVTLCIILTSATLTVAGCAAQQADDGCKKRELGGLDVKGTHSECTVASSHWMTCHKQHQEVHCSHTSTLPLLLRGTSSEAPSPVDDLLPSHLSLSPGDVGARPDSAPPQTPQESELDVAPRPWQNAASDMPLDAPPAAPPQLTHRSNEPGSPLFDPTTRRIDAAKSVDAHSASPAAQAPALKSTVTPKESQSEAQQQAHQGGVSSPASPTSPAKPSSTPLPDSTSPRNDDGASELGTHESASPSTASDPHEKQTIEASGPERPTRPTLDPSLPNSDLVGDGSSGSKPSRWRAEVDLPQANTSSPMLTGNSSKPSSSGNALPLKELKAQSANITGAHSSSTTLIASGWDQDVSGNRSNASSPPQPTVSPSAVAETPVASTTVVTTIETSATLSTVQQVFSTSVSTPGSEPSVTLIKVVELTTTPASPTVKGGRLNNPSGALGASWMERLDLQVIFTIVFVVAMSIAAFGAL
ncbi:hypothetical protein IE81DRAFT_364052 [Ceraceosorus guamensis]|uniref:Uncharacterized protein n=1 Tax=Ceraceosorus guamensis TaxID=1522189 RepID=A0A316W661_9BASI|nr:hypothetical protein IE81DRAFT_364052 [Ceraceosorus guamensis]PWN45406.1 hypothetical protein IE81DRAFT_364052 [Ceraceosorus guamensis]